MNSDNRYIPVIAGCEILTALGDINSTWDGLISGESGLQPVTLPDVPNTYPAGKIHSLGNEYGSTQRLENLLKSCLTGLSFLPAQHENCGIIIATTKGAPDELIHHPEEPTGQPWHIGTMVKELTGYRGSQQVISAACASGTVALIQAAKRISTGQSECVLVIGIDLLSSFVVAGFDALKGLSPNPCLPFDTNREGLSLGEGMGVVFVCSKNYASNQRLEIIAEFAGWGVSCDATHITAPSRTGSGLIRVINQATNDGAVTIGAINAHGTGTVYNDAMEMTAFTACWNEQPPFHSVKGAIGHCLGAAGVIEAAVAFRSLAEKCIPPSVGYINGDAPPETISGSSPLPLTAPSILTCNSGFGGINAGIVFTKP